MAGLFWQGWVFKSNKFLLLPLGLNQRQRLPPSKPVGVGDILRKSGDAESLELKSVKKMTNPRPTLPAGKSCEDCKKYKVCRVIHGVVPTQEICDWPSLQFIPKT